MPFTTERLVLRAYVEEDLDKVVQLMDDQRLQPLLRIDSIAPMGPTWKDKMRKWFDEVCVFACIIEMKGTGEFMGYGGLKLPEPKNRDGTFAITLAPQFWGGGYGAEAMRYIVDHGFRWYGLHRVSLGTFGSNERAIAMYSKMYVSFARVSSSYSLIISLEGS